MKKLFKMSYTKRIWTKRFKFAFKTSKRLSSWAVFLICKLSLEKSIMYLHTLFKVCLILTWPIRIYLTADIFTFSKSNVKLCTWNCGTNGRVFQLINAVVYFLQMCKTFSNKLYAVLDNLHINYEKHSTPKP